ncbi:MAG: ABC transporter substrate-binding protein [Oscillatoria princeps RMCB-10]|jgi:ABC-type branched-subunit amino acid transport system substrate-binding protein/serine/threonine protein kinase|nr:ABC transporter substrate-binding protein [Oscillatoria princeps RMCB-10]
MSYCINPQCRYRDNPNPSECGASCHYEFLRSQHGYELVRSLRGFNGHNAEIFEVKHRDRPEPQVMKVLRDSSSDSHPENDHYLITLFKREAQVLNQLSHPKVARFHEYFIFSPPDATERLHCLVMDKIAGQNLQEWVRSHGPITEEQALDWLRQLALILEQVHQNNIIHRDIKPSNIMRREPSGELVLIDFGAVREVTETVIRRQEVTKVLSVGYTATEQEDRKPVPQSDFFSLGRTFVYLLTGEEPKNLGNKSNPNKINWRDKAPNLSRNLADFIDKLMSPQIKNRPQNPQEILRFLKELEQPPTKVDAPHYKLLAGSAALLLLGLAAATGGWYITEPGGCSKIGIRSFPQGDDLSCGEEILIPDAQVPAKQNGANAFANGNYSVAINRLDEAWKTRRDPETLIYLNNARLMKQNAYAHPIAVVAPITNNPDNAQEILRGVAQAQDEFNGDPKNNGTGLKVLIADDANDRAKAKLIANALVSKGDILATVGHFSSDATLEAVPVYQQHQLVLIAAASTSVDLVPYGNMINHVFFRTTHNNSVSAPALAGYLINRAQQKKAAVFYNPQSNYSRDLRQQFRISFEASGGAVIEEVDLSDASFNAGTAINRAQQKGATALVLFPDSQKRENSFLHTLPVITANQGRYWMMGGDNLYNPDILKIVGPAAANCLVAAIYWHSSSNSNPEFSKAAKEKWGGEVSWRTASAYDATRALIAALAKKPQPNRSDVRLALSDPYFKASGATGTISFSGGERKEPVIDLVKLVRDKCSTGYVFVPVDASEDSAEKPACTGTP